MIFIKLLLIICSLNGLSSQTVVWNPLNNIFESFGNTTAALNKYINEQRVKVENNFKEYYETWKNVSGNVVNYISDKDVELRKNMKSYMSDIDKSSKEIINKISTAIPPIISKSDNENPDIFLTVPASITRHGYECETYNVITEDGFILSIHRIPHSDKSKEISSSAVLLQHGLFGSSADWTMAGPNRSLSYILSDAGYDVWMTNIRGNTYSRNHIEFKPDSKEFWNFSWHEAAIYDLPSVVKLINSKKGDNSKIIYVGHSMGTTMLMTLLAMKPDYNHILNAAFLLSPVVYTSDIKGPLSILSSLNQDNEFSKLFNTYELKPPTIFMRLLSQTSCDINSVDKLFCQNAIFSFSGFDEDQIDLELLPVINAHVPAGVSSKTLIHYAQEVNNGGKFQQFDYGESENLIKYNYKIPPEYDINNITLPIALFWGKNDWLSSKIDVDKLFSKFINPIELYTIPYEKFNHIDFLWAKDAPILVYEKLIELLKKYS